MRTDMSQTLFLHLLSAYQLQNPTLFGISVDKEGHPIIEAEHALPDLHFSYKDVPFTVTFERQEDEWRMTLYGTMGPIPYSCENAHMRSKLLNLLIVLAERAHHRLKPQVTMDKYLLLTYETSLPQNFTTSHVLTDLVYPLWEIAPFLHLVH